MTIDVSAVEAIDVHVHAEVGRGGGWAAAGVACGGGHVLRRARAADRGRGRGLLPRAQARGGHLHGRRGDGDRAPAVPNEEIAEVAAANPDVLIPFASVDPNKGARAVEEAKRLIRDYGVKGFKLHPNVQASTQRSRGLSAVRGRRRGGLPALFHTGHSGIGAGLPGGGGIRLKYSNPMYVDDVAVDFPELKIVLAHPPFPGRTRRSRSRCTSSRSTSTSPAGRRSTSRRSSSSTRTRCCATACSSGPTSR